MRSNSSKMKYFLTITLCVIIATMFMFHWQYDTVSKSLRLQSKSGDLSYKTKFIASSSFFTNTSDKISMHGYKNDDVLSIEKSLVKNKPHTITNGLLTSGIENDNSSAFPTHSPIITHNKLMTSRKRTSVKKFPQRDFGSRTGHTLEKKQSLDMRHTEEEPTDCNILASLPNINETVIHNLWHVTRLRQDRLIYATKAYFDDRPLVENGPFLRFIVVTDVAVHPYLLDADIYCYVWSGLDSGEPFIARAEVRQYMQIVRNRFIGTKWINAYFSCPLTNASFGRHQSGRATHVAIKDEPCAHVSALIPVIYPPKPDEFEHEIGMCFGSGTLYGRFDDDFAPWLIEWFEAIRMFGIQEFNINNGTLQASEEAWKVLKHYQDAGVLNLIQLPPPLYTYGTTDQATGNIAMRIAINDCLYMNMYRYKYLAVFDFDEIIVPTEYDTYHKMLTRTPEYSAPCRGCGGESGSVMFSSRLYCLLYQSFQTASNLTTATYRLRSNVTGTVKNFINPRICTFIWTHGCLEPVRKGIPKSLGRSKVGYVHHYRRSCRGAMTARPQEGRRMLDFEDRLLARVNRVTKDLSP